MQGFLKIFLLGFFIFYENISMAYEEPRYEVIKTFQEFELRKYEPYIVAETSVYGNFPDVGNQAFRRLFAYISEEKRPQGKIAMTSPVIQQLDPETTEPDNEPDQKTKGRSNRYRFAFVMPANYTLESLPIPSNSEIQLKEVPARLLAARRYSGTWSEEGYRKNETILLDALKKKSLNVIGEPVFARYNAPFSLWFLRRNEVLVEIQPSSYK